jgi:hypothetical protein
MSVTILSLIFIPKNEIFYIEERARMLKEEENEEEEEEKKEMEKGCRRNGARRQKSDRKQYIPMCKQNCRSHPIKIGSFTSNQMPAPRHANVMAENILITDIPIGSIKNHRPRLTELLLMIYLAFGIGRNNRKQLLLTEVRHGFDIQ